MVQLRDQKEIRKYFVLNKSENRRYQNVWDAMKGVIRGRFRTLNVYIIK